MTTSALPIPRRRAQLGRYALWQGGDFVMNVAIITIVLFAMLGVLMIMNIHAQEELAAAQHRPFDLRYKLVMFRELIGPFAMIAPIIAVSGMVSQDRSSGFTRFLFAKPVAPRRFYFQSLLVRFAGLLVVGQVLLLAYGFYEPPTYTPKIIVDLAINFVLVGGLVFLCSVLSKFDGLLVVVFLLLSAIFWDKWEHVTGWRHAITYLVPPVGKAGEIHAWMLGLNPMGNLVAMPFPTKWALWMTGYGLACVALGLYLLRRVPLTKA